MKGIIISILGATTLVSLVLLVLISYNFDTGFWGDTPYVSKSYYVFHPHPDDTCEELTFKFPLVPKANVLQGYVTVEP